MLDVCENAVNERTSSDRAMVMYNYPPNVLAVYDHQLEGVEIIEVNVCCYSSDGKPLQTTLKVVCVKEWCL